MRTHNHTNEQTNHEIMNYINNNGVHVCYQGRNRLEKTRNTNRPTLNFFLFSRPGRWDKQAAMQGQAECRQASTHRPTLSLTCTIGF